MLLLIQISKNGFSKFKVKRKTVDNSNNRLHDVFFYGLYMNEEILKSKGVIPRNKRVGHAKGYKLRIGKMATLLREETSTVHGLIYSLTHKEINTLYAGSGLTEYVSESLLINTDNNQMIATLCCNLMNPPHENEKNDEYYQKLLLCMKKYNLPLP